MKKADGGAVENEKWKIRHESTDLVHLLEVFRLTLFHPSAF